LVFDPHLAQIRCGTVLSIEGGQTLGGKAGKVQA